MEQGWKQGKTRNADSGKAEHYILFYILFTEWKKWSVWVEKN